MGPVNEESAFPGHLSSVELPSIPLATAAGQPGVLVGLPSGLREERASLGYLVLQDWGFEKSGLSWPSVRSWVAKQVSSGVSNSSPFSVCISEFSLVASCMPPPHPPQGLY